MPPKSNLTGLAGKDCTDAFGCSCKTDFYAWANQSWLEDPEVVIPDEYAKWGSFVKLHDESVKAQIKLLQDVAAEASSVDEKKIAQVWQASLDRFKAWSEGKGDYTEVEAEFARLNSCLNVDADAASFTSGCAAYVARCQEFGIGSPLSLGEVANLDDSENIILEVGGGGLSLPSRDYYLDDKYSEQRGWYREHLDKVVALIEPRGGAKSLEDDFATRVIRFETKLAKIAMKPGQRRLYDQYYTVTDVDGVTTGLNDLRHLAAKEANYAEHVAEPADEDNALLTQATWEADADAKEVAGRFWAKVYEDLKLKEVMAANYKANYPSATAEEAEKAQYRMIAFDGDYFRRILPLLLRTSNRQDLRAFFQYKIIKSAAGVSTKALNEEFFDFNSRKLGGQKEQKTDEKRSVALVNGWVGELLGKIYVAKFFSEADKQTVRTMITDVLDIMQNSLKQNDWLTDKTKSLAAQKLDKFVVKIGFPDKWKNYDLLNFEPGDSLFTMNQKVNAFEHKDDFLDKLNSVKDKTKWEMTPQTVNAYFHPLNNEIVFPAAILQPPFYHRTSAAADFELADTPEALEAANFGGIGAVIAHEITHGYDDQGRKFDKDGNCKDWWEAEDAELFKTKTSLMADQAKLWTFEETKEEGDATVHTLNPDLTMGENLADLGGMSLAVQALEKRRGGLDQANAQAFFRSWANVWKEKETKASVIKGLATDPHAPPSFRTNLCKNLDAFYVAFDVQPEDPMYLPPDQRVKMW